MTSLGINRFAEFFEAVNGFKPYAWQVRLCEYILSNGRWPQVIDAPTGSGKSSVLDVFVYTVAHMVRNPGQRVPRRLALTVNRRALVDNNADHAGKLAEKLRGAKEGILAEVAGALRELRQWCSVELKDHGPEGTDPLVVSTLRGGLQPDRDWLDDPAACTILSATPDMWGSRLLFQGYGSSNGSHPREAGLLAMDTLVIVDEAHLNQQLLATARQVSKLVSREGALDSGTELQVVEMTATPSKDSVLTDEEPVVIGVKADDLDKEPSLASKLCRAKPVALVPTDHIPCGSSATVRSRAADAFVEQILDLSQAVQGTIACVVNTVELAAAIAEKLAKETLPMTSASPRAGKHPAVKTLVGRMRPYDIALLKSEHPGLFTHQGAPELDVVVATQTIEVGLDMDFAAMVTELAPGSSLAQRAGRVNRSGTRDSAPVAVLIPTAPLSEKSRETPPYGWEELEEARVWLQERAEAPEGLAAWALHPNGGKAVPPPARARRPVFHRPEAWNAELWSRTGQRLFAPISLNLWLQDQLDPDDTAGLVVRAGLPNSSAVVTQQFEQAPILSHEVFPVSVNLLYRLLQERVVPLLGYVDSPAAFLVRDGEYLPLNEVFQANNGRSVRLYPGDLVLLDASMPVFREGVPSPDGTKPAHDVSEQPLPDTLASNTDIRAFRISSGSAVLQELTQDDSDRLLEALRQISQNPEAETEDRERMLRDRLLDSTTGLNAKESPRACELHRLLSGDGAEGPKDITFRMAPQAAASQDFWLVISGAKLSDSIEDIRQEWTPQGGHVELSTHQGHVGASAAALATVLGLPSSLTSALKNAGTLHDEGKKDKRFQFALRARAGVHEDKVLAKSGMRDRGLARRRRAASGLPPGWRHEQRSAAAVWLALTEGPAEDRDLVTRLAGTSHGHGRALFNSVGELLTADADEALKLSTQELYDDGEWDLIMDRTNARHGIWGMAYLEALLRAADISVSKRGS